MIKGRCNAVIFFVLTPHTTTFKPIKWPLIFYKDSMNGSRDNRHIRLGTIGKNGLWSKSIFLGGSSQRSQLIWILCLAWQRAFRRFIDVIRVLVKPFKTFERLIRSAPRNRLALIHRIFSFNAALYRLVFFAIWFFCMHVQCIYQYIHIF